MIRGASAVHGFVGGQSVHPDHNRASLEIKAEEKQTRLKTHKRSKENTDLTGQYKTGTFLMAAPFSGFDLEWCCSWSSSFFFFFF